MVNQTDYSNNVALRNLVKPKRDWLFTLFLLLIFVTSTWPDYVELKFSGMPNMAPSRLIRITLICGFFWMIFHDPQRSKLFFRRLSDNWVLISTLIVFYGLRIISAFFSDNTIFQLFSFFRSDVLVNLPLFFIAIAVIKDENSVIKIYNVLIAAGLIASVFAILDFYFEKNIFSSFVPISSDYLLTIFIDKSRDSAYRAQGSFEHPILLGQFFALILPIVWIKFRESKSNSGRFYFSISGLLTLSAIYVSGSRAALGIAALFAMLLIAWEIRVWIKTSRNRLAQYFVLSQLPWLILGSTFALYILKEMAVGTSRETQLSSYARIDMIVEGGPKVFEAPILGHGLGEATSVFSLVGRAGLRTLDNFYLLLGLESGMFAPIAFLLFILICILPAIRYVFKGERKATQLLIPCILLIIGYGMQMIIHALQRQMWLLLLFSAIVIVLREHEFSIHNSRHANIKR